MHTPGGSTAVGLPGAKRVEAESFDDISRRVLPVWQRVTAECAGQTVILVAHGVVCKVLLLTLLPAYSVGDWKKIGPIHNVAISELQYEAEQWQAVRVNELPARVASL